METIQQQHIQSTTEFALINGDFLPGDALEILSNLINGKIKFHNLKNFSSQVRFEKDDDYSKRRMKELSRDLHSITELISQCNEQGKTLKIQSSISIKVI